MRGLADHIQQLVLLATVRRQLAEDVLHHHHRAIHNNSEINGPDREQVRRDVSPVQADEREHQSEWDGYRYNQRGADAEKQQAQNHQHQQHAAQ